MNAPIIPHRMPPREHPSTHQAQPRGQVTVVASRRSRREAGWLPWSFFFIRRDSVRTQLITWNVIMLCVLFVLPCVGIRFLVHNRLYATVDHELQMRLTPPNRPPNPPGPGNRGRPGMGRQNQLPPPPDAPRGADTAGQNMPPPEGDGPPQEMGQNGEPGNGADPMRVRPSRNPDSLRPQRYDTDSVPLPPFNHPAVWDPAGYRALRAGEDRVITTTVEALDGEWYRVMTVHGHGPKVAFVQAAFPITSMLETLDTIDRVLLMLMPVCLLCSIFGGAFLTDRVLRPLRQMTRSAEHIGAQNFDERLPVIGDDEFSELAETFNNLLGRQETAYTQQKRALEQMRRFTADASHELKTPLTVIQGNAGMALSGPPDVATYRQTLQEIDTAARGMSHLVHDLLLLARSDSGQLGRNVIELLVGELLGLAKSRVPVGTHARITLRLESPDLSVIGNEMELVRLFSNLIDNATHYTPETGRVTVTARRRGERGEWVEVKVADNGIGIAPEHLAHLGERFYRADTSRSRPTGGSGLGLSICKGIVEAHGGTISFASAPGVGTTVTVFLPHRPS